MADLIHKSAAIDICEVCREAGDGDLRTVIYRISKLPAVDAVEVVHGWWDASGRYRFPSGATACRCSECGCALSISEYRIYNWNYCPVCGAKMDGERRKENAAD